MSTALNLLPLAFLVLTNNIEAVQGNPLPPHPQGWLTGEQDNNTKIQKIEKYLRGFDQPMLEVGQRFTTLHQAITDKNYELATYHWKKIKVTIENGLMKRPKRARNAKVLLLDSNWADILSDFKSNDHKRAALGFNKAKATCLSCHIAENKEFINDQPMFKLTK